MTLRQLVFVFIFVTLLSACSGGGQDGGQAVSATTPAAQSSAQSSAELSTDAGPLNAEAVEIVPGLVSRKLRNGYGRKALAGDYADVHYTGWLYDEAAEDGRGEKFDSSVDRGQHFQFTLGAQQVITGWDQGVEGMMIGEVRELTIAPELAYGERGRGAIPPGATLVFEVELLGLESPLAVDE